MVPEGAIAERRETSRVRTPPRTEETTTAHPLPFQQVLVDDTVLEETPRRRQMRWAPVQDFEAEPSQDAYPQRSYSARTVGHPHVPGSRSEAAVADEARARAELERIEAQHAEEARLRALHREDDRREREEAVRAEAARIEAERIAAVARAAAEREALRTPLPKRTAQYAPLREEGVRSPYEAVSPVGAEGAGDGGERPLPQWNFSGTKVTIVDDSAEAGRAGAARASVLAPDLPEGTLTGALAEVPNTTGMLNRVTMRPTATGMIPVVKRDAQRS